MADNLSELFMQCSADMERCSQTQLADCFLPTGIDASIAEYETTAVDDIQQWLSHESVTPVEVLLAASSAGLIPTHQPPSQFPDNESCNQYLLQHLERRHYCIRTVQPDDLPALLLLEDSCWATPLRTSETVLTQRIDNYPQGQLVLEVDNRVVGVIYSQCIDSAGQLNGISVTEADSLHNAAATTVQLLAVNILPQMQQYNLGDQLLEFMLIYRSLQPAVQSVVAITLCKNFDRSTGLSIDDYIRQRNPQQVLADPILRFHELHGAKIERVMPGYRPLDTKNQGCGVLVSYDIHHRCRKALPIETVVNDPIESKKHSRTDIRSSVQNAINACLGADRKAAFAFDRPLMEMGLDSADLLELNEKIVHQYNKPLTPTFFFQHNTAEKIIDYLSAQVGDNQQPADKTEDVEPTQIPVQITPKPQYESRTDDVAIIGIACRFPGGINTPEDFWQCLQSGRSVVGQVPEGRWQWPDEIKPNGRHKGIDRGGFLDNIASFDAPFFRISPAEAESMDPQQRILLELSWQAIEHAGYAADLFKGSNTGVFIGASGSDYARLLEQCRAPVDAHYGTGSSMAVLANRLSYYYDFHGPSLLLDTACSSSLVAVHKAVQSIQSGESEQALVGGINLICHPVNSIAYYKAGMLAKDGSCKTFDQQANGYVRSEGAVMLLLKPLAAALADGDQIHALIKGTASNHGGQAGGLTVPNPEQQAKLLQSAWQTAGIAPSSLGYIEAHGTGTSLGDPIEVQGLKQAFIQAGVPVSAPVEKSCGLGSVKTNLGHLEAAAGITGLLKTVLCLQHKQLPASLNFKRLNEHIQLSDSGLYIVEQLQPWSPPSGGGPRLAGVSSFGSGGANAHAVLAESPVTAEEKEIETDRPLLFVLSAKTRPQLQIYAQNYLDWLSADDNRSVSLSNLVFTLQTGRQAMEERLALVVNDRQDLIDKLAAVCANPAQQAKVLSSKSVPAQFNQLTEGEAGQVFIRSLIAQNDLDNIALLWLSGVHIDWTLLYGDFDTALPHRIAVLTYPFAEHHYWLPGADSEPVNNSPDLAGVVDAEQDSAGEVKPTLLAPLWHIIETHRPTAQSLPANNTVLIIGGNESQQQAIRAIYRNTHAIAINPSVSIASLSGQLKLLADIDHLIWIAPELDNDIAIDQSLITRQNAGLLYVFKLVKALLALSYGDKALCWTVITSGSQAVFNEQLEQPAHAGVHGLMGALAKEYPRWAIRAVDMETDRNWPMPDILSLPYQAQGDVLAHRNGQWFKRVLSPVAELPESSPVYRQQGVYLVVGGAGGIGEAWTRYVIEHYQAQVIWLGRRNPDSGIQSKLEKLAEYGPAPVYISADAADLDSLQAAYADIKQTWPQIHGVIHSAVGLFDYSLLDMDEQRFGDIVSAKIDISVNLAQVFSDEPLDFLLYFSSIVALEKSGGLSGYAAGGAFEDALALHLAKLRPYAVKVINWGHWDVGTGDAISDATKKRLQLSGIIPIQADEAMTVLQQLLAAPVNQLALLKATDLQVLPIIDQQQAVNIYSDGIQSCIEQIPPVSADLISRVQALKPLSLFNNTAMEAQLLPLLACTLQTLGLLTESDTASGKVTGFYRQWLLASRKILAEHGIDQPASDNLDQLWQHWRQAKQSGFADADMKAAVELVELCLHALPEILTGSTRATDVLFPDSSMCRVEGIYRNNAVADFFNSVLGESLVSAIKSRLQQDPNATLRILEIGAGTGGTTAAILPLLAPYSRHIVEYAYTDVSKAFLFHAEQQFVGDYPFVRPKLFDVEKPLAGQAITGQSYDMVIATNVLHATRNIRRTLTNSKAALRKNGLLLLNEISTHSLFAHLTFGLLEGWWLSDDQCLRIAGAPGLYPESWQTVLSQQGFKRVLFPAPESHQLGQQVIVAESDGIVSQHQLGQQTEVDAAVSEPAKTVETDSSENLKQASNHYLKKLVAKSLRMNSADIDALEPLETYGIDSILVGQITNALREIFPDVGSTILFECQTVNALSDYFMLHKQSQLIQLTGLAQQAVTSASSASNARTTTEKPAEQRAASTGADKRSDMGDEAIAVIGMSCRFPQADTVDQYWQLLKTGQNCIREVPAERWPLSGFYHADPDQAVEQGKSYSKWGGFLDKVTEFDPLFFNISPKEAIAIDPQERLFLQIVWEALEDAGYTRERLINECRQQVGVFAGITRTGFDLFGPPLWRKGSTLYPHTSFSSVANRVSYFLNARGPSVPVDTMCSSSLTAIHQACQSLRSGECRVAIAGGVNIYLHPSGYVGLSASRMLSEDGVCRSFGMGGNGFVPGEGVAAVLLKPLSQAIADNDRIYATIRASHVNHGGKTNGYTVPNPNAQAELIQEAIHKAGVDARAVSYIEAHGTGTELGDPIEVSGLTQAFRQFTQDNGFCALGSAKSNIGHLEASAGIAGFIKVILQLQHKQLVPSLHASELNPKIDFARTPFIVQQSLTDWQRPVLLKDGKAVEQPRIAGISSFGAGGANAHVIVEEYRQPEPLPNTDNKPCMVLLSAKNQERLKAYAGKLQQFIERQLAAGEPLSLQDLAYTLQVGREQIDHRLALVVQSLPQLQEKLQAYLSDRPDVADLYQGQVKQHKELIAAFTGDDAMQQTLTAWFVQHKYARLLNLWSKGLQIDWGKLYQALGEPLPKRISAPTYPFTETAYWFPVEPLEDLSEAVPEQVATPKPTVQAAVLADSSQVRTEKADRPTLAKPSHITLANPGLVSASFPLPAARQPICLSPLLGFDSTLANTVPTEIPGSAGIALYDHGAGVFAIKVNLVDGKPVTIESACTGLINCLQQINTLVDESTGQGTTPKALLLTGLEQLFAVEDAVAENTLLDKTVAAIAGCRVPVIAVLSGENRHHALLMAAAADIMVLSKIGLYRFAAPVKSETAHALFAHRFGKAKTRKLAEPKSFTGDQLLTEAGLTLAVVEQAEPESYALTLARSIAQLSATAVIELKRHLNADTRMLLENPSAVPVDDSIDRGQALAAGFVWPANAVSDPIQTPEPVVLDSDVVTLQKYPDGVVVVNLHDRSSKNTFSPEFVNGVISAFEHINNTPEYKAVILTGYDSYFACGGTKQGLLDIQNGTARFTDEQSYSMPLLCELPVIAAMQGHAIGAGWAMGLYCDCTVYSEESVYQSPYMRYGFTPGAGSTLIFPDRLGYDLSREVLLSAEEFQGRTLKQHNIDSPVLPRNQVSDYALALGHHLAQSSRQQLVLQKTRRSEHLRQRLPSFFAAELAMHDKTFVGQQTVIDNINRYFNNAGEQNRPVTTGALNIDSSVEHLLLTLRQSLIEELQMQQEQVDDDATFIDMGMDSITAVTWIRKINKQFGLSIGATKVYSYPTLNRFADFVRTQLLQPVQQAVTTQVEKTGADAGSVLSWLRESLAKELLMTPEMIDQDCKFIDMGLDSITAVTWIRAINKHYGLSVGATKVYSYPTLAEFYQYLLKLVAEQGSVAASANIPGPEDNPSIELVEQQACDDLTEPVLVYTWPLTRATGQPQEATQPVQTEALPAQQPQQADTKAATQSIAIIGMAGQFPKAENIGQFWQNLLQGRECISDIPATRWAIDEYYDPDRNVPGKTVCKRMGVLDDIDVFDPLFFNIAPSEAEYMDPQQRLFLQNSWRCIEDAGYDPTKLSGSLCGVFVGCAVSDYAQLMTGQPHSAQLLMGESVSMLPARIAYCLNLQGPSLAIDTACSSSLVALASACDSLVLGHSDMALAGGVYIINGPDIQVKMSSAGMLSPDGRCFSFDQRANGFVPGEGVGVLLLKRLADAERDGDDIYGVIRGWGINQDGKSNGITAPNQAAQTRLETGIYQKFDINPEHIQLVEAHGTGTKLGDPIEVEALRETFKQFTDKRNYCALGSVKSNIGHLATAAGVTGVIKSVLALSHKQLPPTINYQSLNEHIDLQGSPFYINNQCRSWPEPTGQARLATVSSFGFSGTNAHMVLAEPAAKTPAVSTDAPVLLVLSAKSEQQLAIYAQAVSDYLQHNYDSQAVTLADLAFTFQTGRAEMNYRLAVLADTAEVLKNRLSAFAATGLTDENCLTGKVGDKAGVSTGQQENSELRQLAERWLTGETVDWSTLYQPGQAQRKHGLPTYPFAREHYWVPKAENVDPVEAAPPNCNREPLPINLELWQDSALPEAMDWGKQLQSYRDKQLMVIYTDDSERQAFSRLLTQLKQAVGLTTGLSEGQDVHYYPITEIDAASTAKRPDCLMFLSGHKLACGDGASLVQQWLSLFAETADAKPVQRLLLLTADQAQAERLVELVNEIGQQAQGLLLTLSESQELAVTMQRLFTEWLALAASQPAGPLRQVHYAGDRRLLRRCVIEPDSDRIHLIKKRWQPKATQPSDRSGIYGTVLILVNHESLEIAKTLLKPDDFKEIVLIGDNSIAANQIQNSIDFKDTESIKISANILIDQYDDISHIIDFGDLYRNAKDKDADNPGKVVFYQTLIGTFNDLALLYFTKGLQYFRTETMSVAGAKFAGLVKMISADYPHISARLIDIDQSCYDQPQQLRQIVMQEFAGELQETELCFRDGQRFAPVLSAVAADVQEPAPLPIAQDGVYVISGGTNGVGLEIAKYLTAQGCNKLVLMGVTPLPPKDSWEQELANDDLNPYVKNKLPALIELDKAVEQLQIYTGSITSLYSLKRYFKKIRAKLGPIRGVIHAAGVYSDADNPGFAGKSLARMQQVWEPKINGLECLHTLFKTDTLDFFVTLSSVTGVIPHMARGAADYAMANSFVNLFTAYQCHQNKQTHYKTLIWSDWKQAGAITRIAADKVKRVEDNFHRLGLRTFSNQEGCVLFERAMSCYEDSSVFIGYLDRSRFDRASSQLLFARMDIEPQELADKVPETSPVILDTSILSHLEHWEAEKRSGINVPVERITEVIDLARIKQLPPNLIHRIHKLLFAAVPQPAKTDVLDLEQTISHTVMEVLKLKQFDPTQPFQNYGLDSISAMVLATRLEKKLQRTVQPQWLIDYATVQTLSDYLLAQAATKQPDKHQ